jgi:CRISPR-associated endonuclease/helicase Cas3
MSGVTIDQFDEYFRELHGHEPYAWQRDLASRSIGGNWPGAIDLPTGSGKTACIDVAVFVLACQAARPLSERDAPRRVFFCVNRRVIVDEAHQRAMRIAEAIWQAERDAATDKPVLREVAAALRLNSGSQAGDDTPPLDVLELRGGIYRDNRWARSATQPMIVCTTIDQLGSRLLFRGYGVSPNAAPIQAALIAYDSLILLDEAHISRPFLQTLDYVRRYLGPQTWAEQDIGMKPAIVVPMTATPPEGVSSDDVVHLTNKDRKNKALGQRLTVSKPAELRRVDNVASAAVDAAKKLAKDRPTAVGIIVNRVAIAREIYNKLRESRHDALVELVIGSMRPIDRDVQAGRLRSVVGPGRPAVTEQTSFIVSTQCLEVGADYDFDALVAECASLDALRQRFGRLNRGGRKSAAKAVILANKKDIKPPDKLDDAKPLDPIYGNALARTWNWLNEHATGQTIDFGIDVFNGLLQRHCEAGRIPSELLAPSASLDAPVMLPAYVDFWCQTAPRPVPDPDVSLFIHGPERGEPDVQVCWRADLVEGGHVSWCDVVALLPPTAAECMSVPISRVRRWLANRPDHAAGGGDVLDAAAEESAEGQSDSTCPASCRPGVIWRGVRDSILVSSADDLRPGDTLVLPVAAGGWDELGYIPEPDAPPNGDAMNLQPLASALARIDSAEKAYRVARARVVVRIHPALRPMWPQAASVDRLFAVLGSPDDRPTPTELRQALRTAATDLKSSDPCLARHLQELGTPPSPLREEYPDGRGVVLKSRRPERIRSALTSTLPVLDDGDDEPSRIRRLDPIPLSEHTVHVGDALDLALRLLPINAPPEALRAAVRFHDLGKADERFQAMLRRTDRTDVWLLTSVTSALLAKSDGLPTTRSEREAACHRAGLPVGFRHEMLSAQLAEYISGLPDSAAERDLILHLIAAHHGYARPFAPVVLDDDPPDVEIDGVTLTAAERSRTPPHRLDSGIAERFWSLTRRFGWWGLAYLEAVLRLADQQASAAEDAGAWQNTAINEPSETVA